MPERERFTVGPAQTVSRRSIGPRTPTSVDVATAAGVSQATVSRALRGSSRVSPETTAHVRRVAARLGYVASERGRSLATRRTGRIGVVVEDLGNPFYLELLDALHEQLDRADVRMTVLAPGERDPARIETLADGSIDGVVLTTTTLDSTLPDRLRRHHVPFVLLNRVVDDPAVDSCCADNEGGAAAAARAMLEHGHKRIGAIFGPARTSTGRDRERGLRAALHAGGHPLDERLVRRGRFSFADGACLLGELLDLSGPPTAVFCANDVIALGAHDTSLRRGITVGRELSLVGFDDIRMSGWAAFSLTTARQDLRRMVAIATGLLLARLDDPAAAPRQVVVASRLIHRATLGSAPS